MSVARIVKVAGGSRANFYRHYVNREVALVDAYREVAERCHRAAAELERTEARLREVLTLVLAAAEADSAAASMITIGSRSSRSLRARRARLERLGEAIIGRCLRLRAADGDGCLCVPHRAVLGGIEAVVARRLLEGEATRICPLFFDLLGWLDAYEVDGRLGRELPDWVDLGRQLGPPASAVEPLPSLSRLPRGRNALPKATVASRQRFRIMTAVARLSSEIGYEAMTTVDITAAAGISRSTFYHCFEGKEDAFLETQRASLQRSIAISAEAFFGPSDWPDRVWAGLEAMLGYVAAQPELAALEFFESFAAGPAAISRSIDNRLAFGLFLEEGYAQTRAARKLPKLCSEAIGGAILELLRTLVQAGRAEQAMGILPAAAHLALGPFLGAEEAIRFIEAKVEERAGRLKLPAQPGLAPLSD